MDDLIQQPYNIYIYIKENHLFRSDEYMDTCLNKYIDKKFHNNT
jgi:hypothetical protein